MSKYEEIGVPAIYLEEPLEKWELKEFAKLTGGKLYLFFGDYESSVSRMSRLFMALHDKEATSIKMVPFSRLVDNWKRGIDPEAMEAMKGDMERPGWLGLYYMNDDFLRAVLSQQSANFIYWFRSSLEKRILNKKFTVISLSRMLDDNKALAKVFGGDNVITSRMERHGGS